MIFNYTIEDIDGNICDEFEYEVEDDKLRDAFWDILLGYEKDELIDFIVNEYTVEDFKDDLQEYFEDEAIQCRKER